MTPKKIEAFRGAHWFLSNFYPVSVTLDGVKYRSVEHAYQAAKTLDPRERSTILLARHANAAKLLGKRLTLRKDWPKVKLGIMEALLREKFADEYLADKLERTAPALLIEGNWWGDTYWGVCGGVGENHLGKLLMLIRDEPKQPRRER